MKKLVSVIIAAIMIAALLPAAVGAQSMALNGSGWDPEKIVNVRKADPEKAVKDGVVSMYEYDRLNVDLSEESSPLHITFVTGDDMYESLEMLYTMEYYFSWDEVHGINVAIRNKPAVIQQLLGVKGWEKPEDDFCQNVAWGICAKTDNGENPTLYYALAKRTDTGEYLEGHWGQLGAQGDYDPVEGRDYVISYDAVTGYCTIEWSIPLDNFLTEGGGAGSELQFTLWANGGVSTEPDFSSFYGVVLGDFGFGVDRKSMVNHVTYRLIDDPVSSRPFDGDWSYSVLNGEATLMKYFGTEEDVTVPERIGGYGVLGVDAGALSGNARIRSVTIPGCVHRIGKNAFEGCTSLTDIYYGGSEFIWNNFKVALAPGVTVRFAQFTDVPSWEWYAAPVNWAAAKGITSGTSKATFSPDDPCTRAQAVTFLWRAAGRPEPETTENPFSDVGEDDYFYKAVLWALDDNVTMGTGDNTFSPDEPCTRAQIVTFLWRYEGKPSASASPGRANFLDVDDGDYYYAAVRWAAAREITLGTSFDLFSPDVVCSRAQIVTFLYRDIERIPY